MENQLSPRTINRDEAPEYYFFGSRTWFTATGDQTGGAYGLIEHVVPPGAGSPWHVHHAEDETFFIIEGELTFRVGDEPIKAVPDTYLFAPREIPHGFRNDGASDVHMLVMATPAGFEQFVLGLAVPADSGASAVLPDMERVTAAAAEHQIDILGPLPW